MKEIFTKKLADKNVISENGSLVGSLKNVTVDYSTGYLQNIIVEPENSPTQQKTQRIEYNRNKQGEYVIPAHNVTSVQDHIIIS